MLKSWQGTPEQTTRKTRLWKEELLDSDSPEKIRSSFCCGTIVQQSDSSWSYVKDTNTVKPDCRWALLFEFDNGDWVAMLYADSHSKDPAGGTVVARDSNGNVKAYSGHVCGRPFTFGTSISEIYLDLDMSSLEEISVEE